MKTADRWEALEVRHVRAFTAVVEEGSFAGAARQLGYTQSAVSQQIFALERIVGSSVLRRHAGGRRPVELTEAGRLVLAHAHPLLARVKAAQADVAALAAGEAGQLAVGTFQSFGARILPEVLAGFRAVRPAVEVEIRGAVDIDELHTAVETGELDVCFSVLSMAEGPFELRELLADPYVLVTRTGGRQRSLRDLGGERLLLSCSFERRLVEARLLADAILPASYARFDDNGMIQALVASGEGVAVVPRLTVDLEDSRVAVYPLPELAPRQIVALWHAERELSARTRQFVETAVDVCAAWPNARTRAR